MLWVILTQVGQRHDITCLIIITTFVGYPHFNAVNRHTTRNIRQRLHSLLIIVAEIITQEEVAILIITINWHLKTGCLCTTFTRYGLTFRVLLRNQCLHFQLTKFQIGLDTKQCTTSLYQAAIQVHRHITCLQRLDNVVLLSFIVEF